MNGKYYINDKAAATILVVDRNGLTGETYEGGRNVGFTRDEAGNLVVSNAKFPDPWSEATIKVINPETNEMKEYAVPEECGIEGRCDFLGFAKGNLMEDGVLYLTGATTSGVSIMTITGGEVNIDECYPATCDGLTPTSSTVINYFKDIAGEDALLYVTRNAAPMKLIADGENFVASAITLPGKGTCNGAFTFVWDNMQLFVYPQAPNYQNAFAVAEAGATEPIVAVESTFNGNANTYQADWLNAEVDSDEKGVTIYQYYPGGNFTVYRLTKNHGGVEELINDNTNKVVANVRYYNMMGQEMQEANGLTIVVTTYTDGSHSAVKVLK
jgi:YD repeat-containing protein